MQDVTNPQSDYTTLARCESMPLTDCTINQISNDIVSSASAPGLNLSSSSEADLKYQLKRNQSTGNNNSCFRTLLDIQKDEFTTKPCLHSARSGLHG